MNLYFNIEYQTIFGEELVLNIICKKSEGETEIVSYRMNTTDGRHWTCRITQLPASCTDVIDYYYAVDSAGSEKRREWTVEPHRLYLSVAETFLKMPISIRRPLPTASNAERRIICRLRLINGDCDWWCVHRNCAAGNGCSSPVPTWLWAHGRCRGQWK